MAASALYNPGLLCSFFYNQCPFSRRIRGAVGRAIQSKWTRFRNVHRYSPYLQMGQQQATCLYVKWGSSAPREGLGRARAASFLPQLSLPCGF